jgi:hypothetical protein
VNKDVWGLSQVSCLGGSYYYVTFIDVAARKTWVYCIWKKNMMFFIPLRNGKLWLRIRHEIS